MVKWRQVFGTYLNGKRHGFGEFVWANGERYEGWFLTTTCQGRYDGLFDESRYEGILRTIFEVVMANYSPHWEALIRGFIVMTNSRVMLD